MRSSMFEIVPAIYFRQQDLISGIVRVLRPRWCLGYAGSR